MHGIARRKRIRRRRVYQPVIYSPAGCSPSAGGAGNGAHLRQSNAFLDGDEFDFVRSADSSRCRPLFDPMVVLFGGNSFVRFRHSFQHHFPRADQQQNRQLESERFAGRLARTAETLGQIPLRPNHSAANRSRRADLRNDLESLPVIAASQTVEILTSSCIIHKEFDRN